MESRLFFARTGLIKRKAIQMYLSPIGSIKIFSLIFPGGVDV